MNPAPDTPPAAGGVPAGGRPRRLGRLACVVVAGWLAGCGTPSNTGHHPTPVGSGHVPAPKSSTSLAPPRPAGAPAAPASAWSTEADRWLGTPYRTGGTDRNGIDCSGLAQQLHARVGGNRLPRTTTEQFRTGHAIGRADLRPGDLVFFDTLGRGVSHVGVMVGSDRFAHASTSRGVLYSRLAEDYWNRRFVGARRVPRRRPKTLTPRKRSQQTAAPPFSVERL